MYAVRMSIAALVLADARKQGREADPWFDETLRRDAEWLNAVHGSDGWGTEEWDAFWSQGFWAAAGGTAVGRACAAEAGVSVAPR